MHTRGSTKEYESSLYFVAVAAGGEGYLGGSFCFSQCGIVSVSERACVCVSASEGRRCFWRHKTPPLQAREQEPLEREREGEWVCAGESPILAKKKKKQQQQRMLSLPLSLFVFSASCPLL